MTGKLLGTIDRTNAMMALGVWLMAFFVYYFTKAASVSFWDCGEFLAAGYILGIPHPPGTPLYVMLARLFSLLPIDSDLIVRMNLLSVVSSSFTAMFGYLVSVRILRAWFGDRQAGFTRFLIYAGGVCAAAFLAFSHTNWINSVEAEVYGLAMAMSVGMLWLTLIYIENRGTPLAGRIMPLVVLSGFLGIAVHMAVFLMLPALALFFIVKRDAPSTTWYFVAIFFVAELYMIFALSSLPGEIPYYLPVGIVFLIYLFYVFSFERIPRLLIWAGAGFVLSMAPFYEMAIAAVQNLQPGGGISSLMMMVGQIAFGALVLFGLFCLMQYFSGKTARSMKRHYLIVASFVGAAGVMVLLLLIPKGYHMFLLLSALLAAGLVALQWRHFHWPILVAIAGSCLIIVGVWEFAIGLGTALVLILILGLVFHQKTWRSALLILVMALVGYSIHLFIPIRSAQGPALNENNPSQSLSTTINFLERKQYGSMGMVERMFVRRAEWSHQFGDYPRLGFWRFFDQQYGLTDAKFVILFLFGLFGIWEIIRRRPGIGLPLLVLLLISTVGLILYMNFADGSRQVAGVASDHIEVRDRDYFFTTGFILYGLIIGMGIAISIQYVREATAKLAPVWRGGAVGLSMVLLLLPSMALAHNYHLCDRSNNYIAFDYAWNILQSAEENAVLFVNGDNDTFPLWCLQEVYGVRKDVALVNLSLANTKWYIKQLQTTLGLELGWSEEHIDKLRAFRLPDQATLKARGQEIGRGVFAYLDISDREKDSLRSLSVPYGQTFQYRHMAVDKIIYTLFGKRPINFSVTCPRSSQRYLGTPIYDRLTLIGMAWRLNESAGRQNADIERTFEFFTAPGKFQARGVNDTTVYQNETTTRLTRNWANGFMMVADSLRVAGDYDRAEQLVRRARDLIPHAKESVEVLATLYRDRGKPVELQQLMEQTNKTESEKMQVMLGAAYRKAADTAQAISVYEAILDNNAKNRAAFEALLQMYFETKQYLEMTGLLSQWLERNPDDNRVRNMLDEIEKLRDEQQ